MNDPLRQLLIESLANLDLSESERAEAIAEIDRSIERAKAEKPLNAALSRFINSGDSERFMREIEEIIEQFKGDPLAREIIDEFLDRISVNGEQLSRNSEQ